MTTDYRYEALGPDRFQHLCQALLVKNEPAIQCLPTGQGDGGRDAIHRHLGRNPKLTVFQFKFTAHPDKVKDAASWLAETLKSEQPKIQKLIARGLKRYYLLTNVPGTARLSSGTIDKVNDLLTRTIPVPSACWWRDDLNRRLDGASDVKWAYPEILSGADVVALLAGADLGATDRERILDTVKGYVRKQYDDEEDVRFREVDLRHSLFNLFVDVPTTLRFHRGTSSADNRHDASVMFAVGREYRRALARVGSNVSNEAASSLDDDDRGAPRAGAAGLLLHAFAGKEFSRLVLEGAPGQGKSTVVQFVCQIHRRRLIKVDVPLPSHLAPYDANPLRIPFRVDLRDLASWLMGTDPFSIKRSQKLTSGATRTAEGFLAAQVSHLSGGGPFTVADLRSLSKTSPFLLVFDGLDEVADVETRQSIVEEVTSAAHRLQDIGKDVQVVVTSRPSAYAKSPGFSEADFRYCELGSLTRDQIEEYGVRWAKAKGLTSRDSTELLGVLNTKLAEPHIRDLARNPMQLSILLSLLHTRGMSLPDKRTAMYDSYVELFLNREAEKSSVVREHRDLLLDIHRFVAWKLHAEAEIGSGRGSISREDLLNTLRGYLEAEGRDPKLANALFQGMVERVVALVQRTQGMYEFEVQPLREYFCARYLYDTAPHSRAGTETHDSTVDRFDVLARSPYWLNVVRFFAGCFNKGELPALVSSFRDLLEDLEFGRLSSTRELAVLLLRDWVFTQHVRATRELVDLVTDPIGLRFAFRAQDPSMRHTPNIVKLPHQCGQEILIDRCKAVLVQGPPAQYSMEVAHTLATNAPAKALALWWQTEAGHRTGNERTKWFQTGVHLRVLPEINAKMVSRLLDDGVDGPARRRQLLTAGAFQFFEASSREIKWAIQAILAAECRPAGQRSHPLSILARNLTTLMQVGYYYQYYPVQIARDLLHAQGLTGSRRRARKLGSQVQAELERVIQFNAEVRRELEKTPIEWQTDLEPWNTIIEAGRAQWGDQLGLLLAGVSGGIIASKAVEHRHSDLGDSSIEVIGRIQAARANSENETWWKRQLRRAPSEDFAVWTLSLLKTYVPSSLVMKLAPEVDRLVGKYAPNGASRFLTTPYPSARHLARSAARATRLQVRSLPKHLRPETVLVLAYGESADIQLDFYRKYLASYKGQATEVLRFCAMCEYAVAGLEPKRWDSAVAAARHRYGKPDGETADIGDLAQQMRRRGRYQLPRELAVEVIDGAESFPSELVALAQRRLRAGALKQLQPVATTATQRGWSRS